MPKNLLVTMAVDDAQRRTIEGELTGDVQPLYLEEAAPDARRRIVSGADALLSMHLRDELDDAELDALHDDQVVQSISAGVDHFPLGRLPDGIVVQTNAGAFAEPMAEHVLAMYLALSKRLRTEHLKLQDGVFDQFTPTRSVSGSACGIFGFGGIGQAVARRLQSLDVTVRGINRSGEAEEAVSFLGTPADLEHVLRESDGLVICAPLTPETRGVIDREKLELLPDDGMLVNVARGEIVDQHDLYHHLRDTTTFQAGIDAWWHEPLRHGEFELEHPFLELPNVIGSPHNSAQVPGASEAALARAVRLVTRTVIDGEVSNVVDLDPYQ